MNEVEMKIINEAAGVARFSGHAELYRKYLRMFRKQTDFAALSHAMEEERYADAFVVAHNLKSFTGNLSFDRFYETLCAFTDLLRDGADIPAAIEAFPHLCEEYEVLMKEVTKRTDE